MSEFSLERAVVWPIFPQQTTVILTVLQLLLWGILLLKVVIALSASPGEEVSSRLEGRSPSIW